MTYEILEGYAKEIQKNHHKDRGKDLESGEERFKPQKKQDRLLK